MSTPAGEPMWTSPVTPKRSKRWILWTIIGAIIFALAGGGYIAYSKGFLALPFLSPKTDELFAKMVDSMGSITNAQYSFRFIVKTEAKENSATPLFVNTGTSSSGAGLLTEELGAPLIGHGLSDPDDFFKTIPTEMSLDSGFTFYFDDVEDPKKANAFAKLDATYQGGDSSVSIDLEARKKEEALYAVVNKFPSFFFIDLSAIKGKWIKVTPEDATWYSDETLEEIDQKQYTEDAKTILTVALEKELWTAEGNLPTEVIGGVKTQHYQIVMHPEKLGDVYRAIIDKKKIEGKETKNLESALKGIENADTAAQLKRIVENSTFEVWIDRTKAMLRQISWRLRAVPPETSERWKDKQVTATFRITLEKVNEKIAVDTPSPTIDVDEVTRLMTGVTKEEQQFTNQTKAVEAIRLALKTYHDDSNEYPSSLDELATGLVTAYEKCKKEAEANQTNENTNVPLYGLPPPYKCQNLEAESKKKLKTIDTYTDKTYVYVRAGDDYTLEYQIQYYEGMNEYAKADFAEEKNTANSAYLSIEKQSKKAQYFYPSAPTSVAARDAKRVSDIRMMQNALELYYKDQKPSSYPQAPGVVVNKDLLTEKYVSLLPIAPTPVDGDCTEKDNAYTYTSLHSQNGEPCTDPSASCGWYRLEFCLGGESGGLKAGKNIATPSGMGGPDSVNTNQNVNRSQTNRNTKSALNENSNTNQNANRNTNTVTISYTDADKDNIRDSEEPYYDTDPSKADTDGDGYLDGDEVTNGYNPNGSGKIIQSGAWSSCIAPEYGTTCAEYCTSIGKICSNYGTTSRNYPNWATEVWFTTEECSTGAAAGGNQYHCTDPIGDGMARWKCFCK